MNFDLSSELIQVGNLLCILNIFTFSKLIHFHLFRYWETLLQIFWPRFETILRLNIESIRDCDPQKFTNIDKRPHYVGFFIIFKQC